MEILVFLLLAAVWAAWFLPSYFESRRSSPGATTRNFARSTEKLASAAMASTRREVEARRQTLARRRRMLLLLGTLAVVTLVTAIVTSSWLWLVVTLAVDAVFAGYVALLLQIKQQRSLAAPVVPIGAPVAVNEPEPSVKVVAG
ncbi:MAG: hypothetical protein HKN01_00875 [Acidimicrobiia bacterium]|nr:hypothetical protein [Acidimicrobiia bacterium]NNF68296.1 hypothetical protein [Acidimicrobiia bacterium]NNK90943.1 hypothetical protein [Acidimicrobiia bacterium]